MGQPYFNEPWIKVSMEADAIDLDVDDDTVDEDPVLEEDEGDEAGADAADAELDPTAGLDEDPEVPADDTNVDVVEPEDKDAAAKAAIKEEDPKKPVTPPNKDKGSKGSKDALKQGAQKQHGADGYKEQPSVGLYVSDESLNRFYRRLRLPGVQLNYRPLQSLNVAQEGMQVMINGVVQRYEEEQRERYIAAQKKKRFDDYSLIVIGKDTDPHLYQELEQAPEDQAVVLTDPVDSYDDGVVGV